jgi:hypothetical protein
LKRFRRACEIALKTDTQGYHILIPPKSNDKSTEKGAKGKVDDSLSRSAQELNAISWGTFCTDVPSQIMMIPKEQQNVVEKDDLETITYKIQALDCDKLFDRLNLGFHLLRRKKERLQIILKNLGMSPHHQTQDEQDFEIIDLPTNDRKSSRNKTQARSDDEDDITIDSSDGTSNNNR